MRKDQPREQLVAYACRSIRGGHISPVAAFPHDEIDTGYWSFKSALPQSCGLHEPFLPQAPNGTGIGLGYPHELRSPMSEGHYHLHLHPISKQKGHSIHAALAYRHGTQELSASAAAAYRHAQQHGNGLDGYDYRNKVGVQWFGIVAPDHAPSWCHDPKALWSKVDEIEHRKNARLAQELIIALPHQVGLDDHIAMLRAFTLTHCIEPYRMIADIAIHAPPTHHGGDPRNVHAHILLTDRPITANGFAKTKDRRYTDKALVDQFRVGWTTTHNQHMARLGLPYRIDHRTLEQQRQEALQRGDDNHAILLDRTPQIHLGKAAYGRHPHRTIFQDRLRQNREILNANSQRCEARQQEFERQHNRASHAAIQEAARTKYAEETWRPAPAHLHELEAAYSRPAPTGRLSRLTARAFDTKVRERALDLSRTYQHPWFASGHRDDAPSLTGLLLPMVKKTGPGHPAFTVTAKDLIFCFYRLGFINPHELQNALEDITREEERLFAARIAKLKTRPPPPIPKPKRPTYARPQLALKQHLEIRLGHLQAATALHHQRELAFEQRYTSRTRMSPPHGHKLSRARVAPPYAGP